MLLHNLDVKEGWVNRTLCTAVNIEQPDIILVQKTDGIVKAIPRITGEVYRTNYPEHNSHFVSHMLRQYIKFKA
jgi:hypothetical protein